MSPRVARRIATDEHQGQRTRFGDAVIEHVGRVAAAVPREARSTAWLHDLFELTPLDPAQLRTRGLTRVERVALDLLTRVADEGYHVYIRRIAAATGEAGQIARRVKLADLDDHLAHGRIPGDAPPYAWARRVLLDRVDTKPSTQVQCRGHTRAA